MRKYTAVVLLLAWALSALPEQVFAQKRKAAVKKRAVSSQIQGYVFKPAQKEVVDAYVEQLKVPKGFTVTRFAEGLGKARMLAVSDLGFVYVTNPDKGTVTLIRDTNNDGKADENKVVAEQKGVHGIYIQGNTVYLVTIKDVYTTSINTDGSFGSLNKIISDLPDAGQHPNRTLAVGPDGMLYISVGSTCNACSEAEANEEMATILQASSDGSSRKVYAKGLRNTIGFAWHPETKELWGMDHGIDWLGDNEGQEELNKITEGSDYGWPYVYENGKPNVADEPKGTTHEAYAKKTQKPALLYTAHAAPMGMVFYADTRFPEEYRNDAFVAMHGSWNRRDAVGYKVVRINFENGKPTKFDDFLSGFLIDDNKAYFGRPVGLAVHKDGSLLVSDDANGVIYRVAYGEEKEEETKKLPGRR